MQRFNVKFCAGFLFAAILLDAVVGRCVSPEVAVDDHSSPGRLLPIFDDCEGGIGSGSGTGGPASGRTTTFSTQVAQLTALVLKSGVTSEATRGSWSCGSSSGDGKGCFLKSAKYFVDVANKCAPCVLSFVGTDSNADGINDISIRLPIDGRDTTVAKGNASRCPACAAATTNIPKCGGKFLGIGSKEKARSCKLVDEAGCWPDSSRRVLHDCGAGKECAYKVTNAKAKIWCCARKKRGFFSFIHNALRCGSRADSKSKDRDGAVILFE